MFSFPDTLVMNQTDFERRQKILRNHMNTRRITACFTGHRPNKLGGYDWNNPIMQKLKNQLLNVINTLVIRHGITRFISGGALGTDQAAFWCVHLMKQKHPYIQNIVAVPFEKQDQYWRNEHKYWYRKMLEKADEVVYVDTLEDYRDPQVPIGEYSKQKMHKRNEYMVDHSGIIVAVFDGSKGGTYQCLYYARTSYVNQPIWLLNPKQDFQLCIVHT
jgi:uncharacterized phage-like protein YoqJ